MGLNFLVKVKLVFYYLDVDGVPVECQRMLTDKDFKRIRKLKKIKLMKEKGLLEDDSKVEKALHQPEIDIFNLQKEYNQLNAEFDANEEDQDGEEEEGEEQGGEEVIEFEDDEGVEENIEAEEGMEMEDLNSEELKQIMDSDDQGEEMDQEEQLKFISSDDEYWDSDSDEVDLTDPWKINNGFLSKNDINTVSMSKREKMELSREMNKDKMHDRKLRNKIERHQNQKSKTNHAKRKNKPFSMGRNKARLNSSQKLRSAYERIKKTKNQLGKIGRGLKGQNRLKMSKRKSAKMKGGRK